MMDDHHPPRDKINRAIQNGLAACRRSPAPIVTLAQVIDQLHMDATWSTAEVNQVERGLRHVLARIVTREPTQ
jgi:hypothetical protein